MTKRTMALIWASVIILASVLMVSIGLNDAAAFGVISGLSGAAYGSLVTHGACRQGCLQ